MQLTRYQWTQGLLLSRASSWMQANVYLVQYGDQKIVVKDYGNCPLWLRKSLCRFVLRREIKALQRLQNTNLVPRFAGLLDHHAYAMTFIQQAANFTVEAHTLTALEAAVHRMHLLGVAHNDLHRRNILITSQGQPYFIDFGGAYFKSTRTDLIGKIKNTLFEFFVKLDDAKVAKLKSKNHAYLLNEKDKKALDFKKRVSILTLVWKKLINEPFLRKRTWQRRTSRLRQWVAAMSKPS
jgi:tRNA A-37 threonylcarbamoyl transferase component Bud32